MNDQLARGNAWCGRPLRASVLPRLRDRQPLGDTGLAVSPVCIGIVQDPNTIQVAYERGVNFFFFSADMHWPLYQHTRTGLTRLLAGDRGVRDRLTIAVASYVVQPEFGARRGARQPADPFFEALMAVPGLERIDVLVAGSVYGQDARPRLESLDQLRRQRFVGARAIGASFHDRGALLRSTVDRALDLALLRFNARHPGALADVFPLLGPRPRPLLYTFKSTHGHVPEARARQLGVGDDFWSPTVADHYRFALSPPDVDGMLCAPRSPEEVVSLDRALADGPLDLDEIEHLLVLAELEGQAGRRGRQGARSERDLPPAGDGEARRPLPPGGAGR
jgi:hypothetical protein